MTDPSVIVEKRGATMWLTLNRPAALNSMSDALAEELGRAIDSAEGDPDVRVCVITGSGRAFCAGADLVEIGAVAGDPEFAQRLGAFLVRLGRILERIETSRLPIVAAVNGAALAGGIELVLCCDIVIASQSATFGDAHANYGLLPGGGATVRLTRKIGDARTRYLMLTGATVSADEMQRAGLVAQVVPAESLADRAQEIADTLAGRSRPGLAAMKRLILASHDMSREAGLREELDALAVHATSADIVEGLAAFRDRRRPQFTDL